jgi:hypothetical protein
MKQTAVEWLFEQLDISQGYESAIAILEQAKEMEKEQIINAIKLTIEKEYYEQTWAHCGSRNYMAEQYYNETFKSE